MKIKFCFSVFLITIFLVACNSNDYRKKIIGEWIFAGILIESPDRVDEEEGIVEIIQLSDESPANSIPKDLEMGFRFNNDGTCIIYNATFTTTDSINYTAGQKTKYKLLSKKNYNEIQLLNEQDSVFYSYNFDFRNDTLTVIYNQDNQYRFSTYKYIKPEITPIDTTFFDKMIVAADGGTWHQSPSVAISIDKNGNCYFSNVEKQQKHYDFPIGFYYAKLDSALVSLVFRNFQRSNVSELEGSYSILQTDGESTESLFLKNNKIVKRIDDYEFQSPAQFCLSYNTARYLFKLLDMKKTDKFAEFPYFINSCAPLKSSKIFGIFVPDDFGFYLLTEIYSGNSTNVNFKKKYKIGSRSTSGYKEILSDGRYYQYKTTDNKIVTIDIGYDFFEKYRE